MTKSKNIFWVDSSKKVSYYHNYVGNSIQITNYLEINNVKL